MSAIVSLHPSAAAFSSSQLALIRRTVAADCNDDEFNLFVTVARNTGLDPFRKQIYALVYNKDKPDKRKMSIITGIDGMRAVAARSNRYRPDEDEPEFTYDPELKGPLNPLGLVKATTKLFMRDAESSEWRKVAGFAYWEEYAPIREVWKQGENGRWGPSGEFTLEGNWPKMGRLMLAKCSDAVALRKAFPEDLSAVYERSELDRASLEDLTATEQIKRLQEENRLQLIGGKDAVLFQLAPNAPLQHIKAGQIADRIMATVRDYAMVEQLDWFESTNREAMREFWAREKADALEVKAYLEKLREKLTPITQGAA